MKKILLSMLALGLSLPASATSPVYNQYQHHKVMREKVSQWVDWQAQEHALSAVDAFNVVKKKHGIIYMPELFFTRLIQSANQNFNDEGLSALEVAIINESATLFVMSQAHDLPHHELFPAEYTKQVFLDNLSRELELVSPATEDEAQYLQRYYQNDLLGLSIYSIALNISLEKYGESQLIQKLAQQTGGRYADSIRQFLISGFSGGGVFKDRLEAMLLAELKQSATQWKPDYDDFAQYQNGSHPYARVGAMLQTTLLTHWPSLRGSNRENLQQWYQHIEGLPDQKYAYSMVGEALVNEVRQGKQQPHHSRWSFPSFAAITIVTLIAPEVVGELALGELAQGLLFSRTMFNGARVADAAYTSEVVELATEETVALGQQMTQSTALQVSQVADASLIGQQVEPGLHYYLGEGAVEGADFVANIQGTWQRVRRFPSSNEYALFEGVGSFGVHKVTRAGAAGWLLNQTATSLNNWVSSGHYRHVLLLGKGEPASLFRHFGENVKSRYGIPQGNLYSDGDVSSRHLNTLFPNVQSNQLSSLTFNHRLDVVAHGNPYGPVCMNQTGIETSLTPSGLARKLFDLGLRQVGVLKVQSCNVGGGFYLSKLETELRKIGIDVGFLAAPKGYLVQLPRLPRAVFDPFPNFSADRYEVISTGLHQGFPGTRYH
ncbi:hypothetical protein [Vibrio neptunius]|uniref:hypothetical protein n=1 Tax=Vibrio neptunius TaxID=170651 RepID=UPI00214E4A0F|nr:hypothetical protein [Vibrio neptunius]